jgi:hypothetical protein
MTWDSTLFPTPLRVRAEVQPQRVARWFDREPHVKRDKLLPCIQRHALPPLHDEARQTLPAHSEHALPPLHDEQDQTLPCIQRHALPPLHDEARQTLCIPEARPASLPPSHDIDSRRYSCHKTLYSYRSRLLIDARTCVCAAAVLTGSGEITLILNLPYLLRMPTGQCPVNS